MKKGLYFILFFLTFFMLVGCSSKGPNSHDRLKGYNHYSGIDEIDTSGESYLNIRENPYVSVKEKPSSYFSMDTSTASYANLRRMINNNVTLISKNAVKIEEMVNYFSYDYDAPTNEALKISGQITSAPWNSNNKIVSIGVKAKEIDLSQKKPSNIVLLLDVSGSMDYANKLPLLQSAFKLFVETLDSNDTISLVTYASGYKVLLDGVKGFEKQRIMAIIEDLMAGGSTAGSKGIQAAYELAKKHFIKEGHNRVIIGTDGDFNVGVPSYQLKDFISNKRDEEKIYLSVLGFGYGNIKDDNLETLANSGNGTYAYIDTITEARKVLVEEIGGNLNIVSKDTKVKVTFNPKFVKSYRLLGYENQLLTEEEYLDNKKDAGEIGAGHTTTAVYEVVLNDDTTIESTIENGWLNVEITYKDPENDIENHDVLVISKNIDINSELSKNSEDLLFISGVIEFGLILRDSKYMGDANLNDIITRLQNLNTVKNDVYKNEFLDLVKKYKLLMGS